MGPPTVAMYCLGAACVVGCAAGAPIPKLDGVAPARGYSDQALRVLLRGDGFIPSFQLDPAHDARRGHAGGFSGRVGTGAEAVALRDFDWLDTGQLTAWMDPGLPAGVHPVELRDPRGQTAALPQGFTALGPDQDRPVVHFDQPQANAPLAPGVTVRVSVRAEDRAPGVLGELRWETHAGGVLVASRACALTPLPEARCDFDASVPSSIAAMESFVITVLALDRARVPNVTMAEMEFRLHERPSLESIDPPRGGIAGGTDVVVNGSGFLPGARVLVDGVPLAPDGGTVVDEQTITGRVPPHAPGPVTLTLHAATGDSKLPLSFLYAEPPAIAAIQPEEGDAAGGTEVHVIGQGFDGNTQVLFGDSLPLARPLGAAQMISDSEIRGLAPPGSGRTSVWVFDSETGWDQLVDGFGWSGP
jgi:hypothetical protein